MQGSEACNDAGRDAHSLSCRIRNVSCSLPDFGTLDLPYLSVLVLKLLLAEVVVIPEIVQGYEVNVTFDACSRHFPARKCAIGTR
jgi:hypothetical protein